MAYHDLKLSSHAIRAKARLWLDAAPEGAIVRFFPEPTRTLEQNAKLWPSLHDISVQYKHNGQYHSPETWKVLHMHALGHESRFLNGLNGEVFPAGFSSSKLTVKEMSDLLSWIMSWGDQNGIKWSERGFS